MERLMMTVPNFAPRGVGVRFSESQILITVPSLILRLGRAVLLQTGTDVQDLS